MAEGRSLIQTGFNLSAVKADNVTIVVNQAPGENPEGKSDGKNEKKSSRLESDGAAVFENLDGSFSGYEPKTKQETVELTRTITMFTASPLYPGTRVYRGRQTLLQSCRDLAIKILPRSDTNEQEVERGLSVEHPNIVRIIEAGHCFGTVPEIFIAMELCSKNLQEYVNENKHKRFEFEKSFSYSKQLIVAVAFMHKNKIVHRDLKPGNILISMCGNQIKVADLGLSRDVITGQASVTVTTITSGTEGFKAPETYDNISRYAYSADIFPLGICVYFIFTNGKHPFCPKPHRWVGNIEDNVNRDLSGIPQFKAPNYEKRSQLISVLEHMLEHKPVKRPTAEEILKDDFFIENLQVSVTSQVKAMTLSAELPHRVRNFTLGDAVRHNMIVLFDENADCLRSYDPATDKVTKFHDEKFKHPMYFSAVSMDSYIYVLCSNKSVHRLNFRNKNSKWERMRDMISDHGWYPPVVSLSGSLFVIDSSGDTLGWIGKPTSIVERFDPAANQWLRLKDNPEAVIGATLVSLNDSIFCIGGSVDVGVVGRTEQLKSFRRFTPSSSEWVNLTRMKVARCRCGAVAVERRIFVMGGWMETCGGGPDPFDSTIHRNKLYAVECYDLLSKQWNSLTRMINCHGRSVAHHINGSIFLVGLDSDSHKVEKYDISNDRWCKVNFNGVEKFDIFYSVSIKKLLPIFR